MNDECLCCHDKATHYWDSKGSGDCLGRGCDCGGFKHKREGGTYKKQKPPIVENGIATIR